MLLTWGLLNFCVPLSSLSSTSELCLQSYWTRLFRQLVPRQAKVEPTLPSQLSSALESLALMFCSFHHFKRPCFLINRIPLGKLLCMYVTLKILLKCPKQRVPTLTFIMFLKHYVFTCKVSSKTIYFRSHINYWVHSSVLAWVSFKVRLGIIFLSETTKRLSFYV